METIDTIVSVAQGVVLALNMITPLGLCAGMAYIIYQFVAKKGSVNLISNNHLSGLPEMAETLTRIEYSNRRQESTLNEIAKDISFVKGRIQ